MFQVANASTPDYIVNYHALERVDIPQTGIPMIYEHGGKQYLVMVINGSSAASEIVAYTLP